RPLHAPAGPFPAHLPATALAPLLRPALPARVRRPVGRALRCLLAADSLGRSLASALAPLRSCSSLRGSLAAGSRLTGGSPASWPAAGRRRRRTSRGGTGWRPASRAPPPPRTAPP